MGAKEILSAKRAQVLEVAGRYGARNIQVFGSVARGEEDPESDIDLLVDMEPGRSLLDFVALWQDLQELLGRKVDVVTREGLSPYLRDRILGEAVPL